MRKTLIAVASIGSLFAASTAFAAAPDVVGTIKSMSTKYHTLTLSDGKTFKLPANFSMKTLKAGEKVNIAYVSKHKNLMAISVSEVK
jgi:hypothetical protein